MKRIAILLAVLTFGAVAFAQTVGLSVSTLNNPFFVSLQEGAQAAADEAGVELITVDAQDDVSKQLSDIEDLITQGVDVIIVNPTDSAAVVNAVRNANSAGIPVITVDRASEGGEVAYHIASDNVAGGRMAGEYLCELIGGEGSVVELEGIPGASATNDRGSGFNEYMSESCQDAQIVARQTANFNRAEGLSVMENILQAQAQIDGLFAHNDEMALGALQAIDGTGRDVHVIGFDATPDAVQAVEECRIAATVAQQPELMGQMGVEQAIEIAGGAQLPEETEYLPVDLQLVTNDDC